MGSRYNLFKIAEELKEVIEEVNSPLMSSQETIGDLREENKALANEVEDLKEVLSKKIENKEEDNNSNDEIEKNSNWGLDDFSLGSSSDVSDGQSGDPLSDYLLSKQK